MDGALISPGSSTIWGVFMDGTLIKKATNKSKD